MTDIMRSAARLAGTREYGRGLRAVSSRSAQRTALLAEPQIRR
jgi:hypothetical protein